MSSFRHKSAIKVLFYFGNTKHSDYNIMSRNIFSLNRRGTLLHFRGE